MAIMVQAYDLSPAVLWNGIYDVAEMHRAKIKKEHEDVALIETEMYKIKTTYKFRVQPNPNGGASVMVETDGTNEDDERRLRLLLTALESFLASFTEKPVPPAGGGTV